MGVCGGGGWRPLWGWAGGQECAGPPPAGSTNKAAIVCAGRGSWVPPPHLPLHTRIPLTIMGSPPKSKLSPPPPPLPPNFNLTLFHTPGFPPKRKKEGRRTGPPPHPPFIPRGGQRSAGRPPGCDLCARGHVAGACHTHSCVPIPRPQQLPPPKPPPPHKPPWLSSVPSRSPHPQHGVQVPRGSCTPGPLRGIAAPPPYTHTPP